MLGYDMQPAVLVAPYQILIYGYVCVADSYTLHVKTDGWTNHRYYLMSVRRKMDAVCIYAVHSPQRLLHPARLYFNIYNLMAA